MVASYSLLQIRQALAEEAFSGQYPIRITTTGAGSATTVVIADLAYGPSGATVNAYHGCWLYNAKDPPVAPFSSRVLEQGGLTVASGTLTVAPAFGGAPGSGAEIIFCYDVHPDEMARAINRVLRGLIYYAYLPVTLVPDGNMEGVDAQRWSQIGTTTITKGTGLTGDFILFGRQFLSVAAADSGEGARSEDVYVVPNEPLLLSVPIETYANSVAVQLYDSTNSTVIKAVTVSQNTPAEVRFTANAPSTCKAVQVRFVSGTTNASFIVGPITLLSQNRRRYQLDPAQSTTSAQSGFSTIADIQAVYSVPQGVSVAADTYYSFGEPWKQISADFEEDMRAEASAQNIVFATAPSEPIYIMVRRRFPELTTTAATINAATNTTVADRDTVVQGAMYYIERSRYGRVAASNPQLAATHLGRSREYARKFAMMRQAQGYGIVARETPFARTTLAMS